MEKFIVCATFFWPELNGLASPPAQHTTSRGLLWRGRATQPWKDARIYYQPQWVCLLYVRCM